MALANNSSCINKGKSVVTVKMHFTMAHAKQGCLETVEMSKQSTN